MTQYEFLEKARSAHGFKYIYPDLPNKIKTDTVINILYKDVVYSQRVCKHLMGRCPEKNTPIKTTESFIAEAREKWGDTYDYSLVEYKGANKKIKILKDGIIYEQTPVSHLNSAPDFRMSLESFIKQSKDKWGDKYDYSLVDYKNCKTEVKIIHKETGVIYNQKPENHLRSAPENKKQIDTEYFISRANKIHKNRYGYYNSKYKSFKHKIIITCSKHGDFEQLPGSHLSGMGCKKCGDEERDRIYKPKYTTDEFIKAAKNKWGEKYDYSLTNYVNVRTKVKIIFDGIVYHQTPMAHLKYPPENFLDQEIFLLKAKRKWGDKYDYSLVEFVSTHHKVKIIYDGVIYEQLPNNHLNYAPERRNTRTLEEFIEDAKAVHNNKYTYDKSVYIKDSCKITITCPLHGDFEQKPSVHLRGSGCKKCCETIGERKIARVLDEMGLEYKRQHFFEECKNISYLKFDFYLPTLRTCIEFDGIQHFEPIEFFGGITAFERQKKNDSIKQSYCEENFIDLIRIRYDRIDSISDILWESLKFKILGI